MGMRSEESPRFDPQQLDGLGVRIARLETDSRRVQRGDVFLAYPGEKADGRAHIPQALAAGAAAVLWESRGFAWNEAWRVPNLAVHGLKRRAGEIAARVYGAPSQKMWMTGVTGTNGKTSCSHWIAHCLTALGRKTAVIGTLGAGFPGNLQPSGNTTPDAVHLHALLAEFLRRGAQGAAMEVSSHGLDQGRANGVAFDVALLTNLTRDHLDYHRDMESYAAAKARLFHWRGLKHAVVNLDDKFGAELAQRLDARRVNVVRYGLGKGEVSGHRLDLSRHGLTLEIRTPWGEAQVKSRLLGGFNASNLLGVLAVLLVSDVALGDAVQAVSQVQPPAGRLQMLGGENKPLVVVDYAHTPDALEKVLETLREVIAHPEPATRNPQPGTGRLICVFGCGGERDAGKRPLMGEVATRLADKTIVTSDNPRGEEAQVIIRDIIAGAHANYHVIEDRAAAIYEAVARAGAGDVVLIAGKGHETWQEIRGAKLPFSDAEVARKALETVRGEG